MGIDGAKKMIEKANIIDTQNKYVCEDILTWKPKYSLDDGIKELIMGYKIIINNDVSHFRNGFPLTYGASL